MSDDLHPIQEEMLRIEAGFERDAPPPGPPVDACIAKMIEFAGDVDAELDPILRAEARRVVRLARGHYAEWTNMDPLNVAALGILQGITLARAAANLRGRP